MLVSENQETKFYYDEYVVWITILSGEMKSNSKTNM